VVDGGLILFFVRRVVPSACGLGEWRGSWSQAVGSVIFFFGDFLCLGFGDRRWTVRQMYILIPPYLTWWNNDAMM
jgi:hypothetical protein